PACRKDGEERGRATRARDPSPFPTEGQSAGVRRAGLLARGSSSPGPFPPRRAVVVTGVVPPYSCGAAGALHPLPSPVDVGARVARVLRRVKRGFGGTITLTRSEAIPDKLAAWGATSKTSAWARSSSTGRGAPSATS